MTRHQSLHDHAAEAAELLAALAALDATDDPDVVDATIEGETGLKEALSRAISRRDEAELMAKVIKARIADMEIRAARYAHKVEMIETAMEQALELLPPEALPLRLPEATLSMSESGRRVIITDPASVPEAYRRPPKPAEADKTKIRDALKAGADVPGATLSNKTRSLKIRRG